MDEVKVYEEKDIEVLDLIYYLKEGIKRKKDCY